MSLLHWRLFGGEQCFPDCPGCAEERGESNTIGPAINHASDPHRYHADKGKPRWSLVPVRAMRRVLAVLEFGARKYAARSYLTVPDARARYTDSLMRHAMSVLEAVQERGPEAVTVADDETGEPHLAHLVCDALILLDLAAHEEREP